MNVIPPVVFPSWMRLLFAVLPRVRREGEVIVDDEGAYLVRLTYLYTKRFRLYLHVILRDDGDRARHSHPWHFITVPLVNGYREARQKGERRIGPWMPRLRTRSVFHRVFGIKPGRPAITLVLAFVSNRSASAWGFDAGGKLIPSCAYEGLGTKYFFDAWKEFGL